MSATNKPLVVHGYSCFELKGAQVSQAAGGADGGAWHAMQLCRASPTPGAMQTGRLALLKHLSVSHHCQPLRSPTLPS